MTVYLEMTERLKADIDATEAHLAKLKAALAGLQPLITVDAASWTVSGLSIDYEPRGGTPYVEEVEIGESLELAAPPSATAPKKTRGPGKAKRKATTEETSASTVKKPRAAKTSPAAPGTLPATGGKFWLSLMGKRAHTINDLVDRAIASTGAPEHARPILTNRLSAWLYPAIKSGVLEAGSSKGKLKRYQVVAG